MANMPASLACNNVSFNAGSSFVPKLIALKTHLFITFKWVMGVLATKYTIILFSIVWTFFCHVAKLSAIVTLYSRVFFTEVPLALGNLFHLLVSVIVVSRDVVFKIWCSMEGTAIVFFAFLWANNFFSTSLTQFTFIFLRLLLNVFVLVKLVLWIVFVASYKVNSIWCSLSHQEIRVKLCAECRQVRSFNFSGFSLDLMNFIFNLNRIVWRSA